MARGIGILYKCKCFFGQKTLLTLYNSFLYPYLNYCLPVWGNTFETYFDPLVKLQKWAVRIIAGVKRYTPSDSLFKQYKILKLNQIYIYMVHILMFKYRYNTLPEIFSNFFERINASRFHDSFKTPLMHSELRRRTIRFAGVQIYNYISKRISLDVSIATFKSSVKSYIIVNDLSFTSKKGIKCGVPHGVI